MKVLRIILIIFALLALVPLASSVVVEGKSNPLGFAADHILVKFKATTDAATERTIHAKHSGSVIGEVPQLGVEVVRIPKGKVMEEVRAYQREGCVEYAEPDYDVTTASVPNDPDFSKQWGLTTIQAPQAWDITTSNSSVKIAMLDSGVDQDHEDLAAKIVANINFTTSSTVDDLYGHGTGTAGVAAAITNNGIGVAGMGYNATIMNVKVCDDNNQAQTSWVADGIIWAADNGAKVINMSLLTNPSNTLEDAVNYAWGKGVVLVAAAGNNADSDPLYPAAYANCISVAATNYNDTKASFSSYGSWVDVAAPGDYIYICFPNHPNAQGQENYGYWSGTSFAAPLVSGLAALLWSTPYGTSNASVRSRIESTADPIAGTGTYWQYGRINAYKAVSPQPAVNSQPGNQTVTAGGAATFTAAASGEPDPTVQWQVSADSGSTWADITGATSTTLTLTGVALSQNGYEYHAVFSNSAGTATSDAATLTVQPLDIGDAATKRATYAPSSGYTRINYGNPANADGTINTVSVYFVTAATGVEVGTFSSGGSGQFTVRDYATIGSVAAGSTQTFTGLNIQVKAGDYIGIYFVTGQISRDNTGGSGVYYASGNKFGGGANTYTFMSGAVYSLYGSGFSGTPPTLSSDATLSGLNISSGTLTPAFASGTTSYTDRVASSVTLVTVTPTANQGNATITVNGTAVTSGNASGPISLSIGANTINIVVTAQDGTTTETYTVNVTRATPVVIGDAATKRATYAPSSGYTRINYGNPANADGTINTVSVYFVTAATGVEVGTFSSGGSGQFTVRDYATIGSVAAGSTQTFTGLNIQVKAGDYIGIYFVTGQISRDNTGGSGVYYASGNKFGGGANTYTFMSGAVYSLYGSGTGP